MANPASYDITGEIDPVEKLDDIQAKLRARRRQQKQTAESKTPKTADGPSSPTEGKEDQEAAAKKRAANAARKKREEQEQRHEERQQELSESRWVTAGHKVREKRVEHLDRVFHRLKSEGEYSGTKQEFFDEGLAMLERKYAVKA